MKNTIIAAVAALTLGLATTAANAATTNTTFQVSAVVQANCTISAAALAFGNYTGAQNDKTSNLTITCTNTSPYDIGLDAGTTSGATVANRSMVDGSNNKLGYALFSDSAEKVNWGNTVGTDTVKGTGTGATQTVTVYGQIPAAQYVTPGSYSDTITATLTY
jgi:spore coat protein U-like protein